MNVPTWAAATPAAPADAPVRLEGDGALQAGDHGDPQPVDDDSTANAADAGWASSAEESRYLRSWSHAETARITGEQDTPPAPESNSPQQQPTGGLPAPASHEADAASSPLAAQSREKLPDQSLAAFFPAALGTREVLAPTKVDPAAGAVRRIEELGRPAVESSPLQGGRGSKALDSAAQASSPSLQERGIATPAAHGELAFTGRLVQVADGSVPPYASAPASTHGHGENGAGSNGGDSARHQGPAEAAPADSGASEKPASGTSGSPVPGSAAGAGTERGLEERPREPVTASRTSPALETPNLSATPAANPGPRQDAPRAGVPGDTPQPAAAGEAPKPDTTNPGPMRDITLALDSGPQRVAVHLVERGGEVHVAVRTPDTALAGDLRRGLPALTAKLEQNGFRTETWHSGGGLKDPAGQNRQGGRERREGQPQPREDEQRHDRKKERKDFAWFMSSLG